MTLVHTAASQPLYDIPFYPNAFIELPVDGEICGVFPGSCQDKSRNNPRTPVDERLAERAHIAQELHDTMLQGFLAASMQLHVVMDRLSADCAEKQQLEKVARLVDRAIEEGRCALQGMGSSYTHSASLGEALARVPDDLGFPSGAGFRVVVLGT